MMFALQNKLMFSEHTYQWMEILFWTWLTTLMRRRSPSLATMRGPGNCPFTVKMLFVWHSLVTFCNLIYTIFQTRNQNILVSHTRRYILADQNCSAKAIGHIHQTCSAWLCQNPGQGQAQEGGIMPCMRTQKLPQMVVKEEKKHPFLLFFFLFPSLFENYRQSTLMGVTGNACMALIHLPIKVVYI